MSADPRAAVRTARDVARPDGARRGVAQGAVDRDDGLDLHAGAGRPGRGELAAFIAILTVGAALRAHSASALWLDEAQSVYISKLPVGQLMHALRADGSPPLYYLLLHGWIAMFGSGDDAVRSLSTVFGVAALPLAYLAGRRLHGSRGGLGAMALLAVCPFAVRYSTETRMYSLVVFLALAWILAVLRGMERPSAGRLIAIAVFSGLLMLTHYWTLFLLASGGLALVALAVMPGESDARRRRCALRCLAALCAGAILLAPWLPTMWFQMRHTGTPWAPAAGATAAPQTLEAWFGAFAPPDAVAWLLIAAVCVAAALRWRAARSDPASGGRRPARGTGLMIWLSAGTLGLGLIGSRVLSAGYAVRYSSPALVPAVLAAGGALALLPTRLWRPGIAIIAAAGLVASVVGIRDDHRTQAARTAAAIAADLKPGDLVVYCPDQLGPAVSRLLPPGTQQVAYPTLRSPSMVDWIDYAQRNAAANPADIAAELDRRTSGAIWLVMAPGYRTFGRQCQRLDRLLLALRGERVIVNRLDASYGERQATLRYPAPSAPRQP